MSAILKKHKLAYISVPKCACTSIKDLLFTLENKNNFNVFRDKKGAINFTINGEKRYIHYLYPTISFSKQPQEILKNLTTFCVVRDPIERIISCHQNRVMRYRELSHEQLEKNNITGRADPSLEEFISNLETYRRINSIKHHTEPLTHYLGDKQTTYDYIYNLKTLNKLSDLLQDKFRVKINFPHLQASHLKERHHANQLTAKGVKFIEKIYSDDYNIFGNYF